MEEKQQNDWKRIAALLCLGWIMIWIYRTMLTPIHEEIENSVGVRSSLDMGMISSYYFLSYVLTQIPAGYLMDRAGRKTILVPGFLLFAAGIFLTGLAPDIRMIYGGSILAGIGTGAYYSGAYSISAACVPPAYRYFSTAVINSGCAVGMILGYLSGGAVVKTAGVSWRVMVFIAAALTLLTALFLAAGIRKDAPEKTGEKEKKSLPWNRFLTGRMAGVCFLYFCTCYGYYMIVTWLPSFLEAERGIQGVAASLYSCLVAAASIPGALILSRVLDISGKKRVLVMEGLQAGSALMIFFLSHFTALVPMLLCLAVYGLCGKQAIDPLIVPYVSGEIPEKNRSFGLGIFNFFGMSGSVLAPGLTGYAEDMTGSKVYGFFIAVVLLLVSSAVFYIADRKGASDDQIGKQRTPEASGIKKNRWDKK